MAANNVSPVVSERGHGYLVVLWEAMIADSTGLPFTPPAGYDLESVQGFGTFDTSGEVDLEGSNVPGGSGTYAVLKDALGNDITLDAAALKTVLDVHSLYYRPKTAANGGTSAIDVDIYALFRQRN